MLKWLKKFLKQESPTSDTPEERRFVYQGFKDVYGPIAAKAAEELVDVCNEEPKPKTKFKVEDKKGIVQNHWDHFSSESCASFFSASSCSGAPMVAKVNYFKRNIVLDGPNWEIEELPRDGMFWGTRYLCTYKHDGKTYRGLL